MGRLALAIGAALGALLVGTAAWAWMDAEEEESTTLPESDPTGAVEGGLWAPDDDATDAADPFGDVLDFITDTTVELRSIPSQAKLKQLSTRKLTQMLGHAELIEQNWPLAIALRKELHRRDSNVKLVPSGMPESLVTALMGKIQ